MSWDEEERRAAEILGAKEGDKIPSVSRQTLRTYHAYLRANVKFPFKAKVEDLDGDATIQSLFALRDCPDLTFYGLFVRGHHRRSLIEIPIAIIEEVKTKVKTNNSLKIIAFGSGLIGRNCADTLTGNALVVRMHPHEPAIHHHRSSRILGYHTVSFPRTCFEQCLVSTEREMTTMADDFWGRMSGNSLVLYGTYGRCLGRVARVIEERFKS